MKANEVPEKIYIFDNPIFDFTRLSIRQSSDDIEYIRTDAFIEKACKWLRGSITNHPECYRIVSKKGEFTRSLLIEDFVKYMKGENE